MSAVPCTSGFAGCAGTSPRYPASFLPGLVSVATTERICSSHANEICRSIYTCATSDPTKALKVGCVPALLAVLAAHETHEVSVLLALGSLGQVSQSVVVAGGSWDLWLIRAAMDRTCAALQRFESNEFLVLTAADLITTLTRQPDALEAVGTAAVIAALVAMLRGHDASVAEHATFSTRQLALSRSVAPLLLEADITRTVVDTMHRFHAQPQVARNCVSTLSHLVQHAAALPSIVETNAVEAALTALARHKGVVTLPAVGLILQRAVGAHEPGAAAAGKREVVSSLVACLKQYPDDVTFVTHVISALAHICKVGEGVHGRMVIAAGAIPLMAAAMKKYAANFELVNFATSGLEWLRAFNPEAWVPAAKGELAAAYVTAARAHLNNCETATSLVFQLVGLTKGSTADVIKAGAAPLIVAALRKYSDVGAFVRADLWVAARGYENQRRERSCAVCEPWRCGDGGCCAGETSARSGNCSRCFRSVGIVDAGAGCHASFAWHWCHGALDWHDSPPRGWRRDWAQVRRGRSSRD